MIKNMNAKTELESGELLAECPHCGEENIVDWLRIPDRETSTGWCCVFCDTDFGYVSPPRSDDQCDRRELIRHDVEYVMGVEPDEIYLDNKERAESVKR